MVFNAIVTTARKWPEGVAEVSSVLACLLIFFLGVAIGYLFALFEVWVDKKDGIDE